MTHVTDVLRREHYLFARLLDGLEVLISGDRIHDPADREAAGDLLRFFAGYVDGLHQDKEERVLFPRLLARSVRYRAPVVAQLSRHHRRDRRLLGEMRAHLPGFADWTPVDYDPFVTHARVYVRFQRRHMRVEDEWLLPLAAQIFRPEDDRMVRAGFRRIELVHGASFEPTAIDLLGRLTSHLGRVPPSRASSQLDRGISSSLQLSF